MLLITLYRSRSEIVLLVILFTISVLVLGPLVYLTTAGITLDTEIDSLPAGKKFQVLMLLYDFSWFIFKDK